MVPNKVFMLLISDREELGCDALSSPPPASPPPLPDATVEIQCSEAPLPPFYSLRTATGQPAEGLWCLLQDITNMLQVTFVKYVHTTKAFPKITVVIDIFVHSL